MGIGPKNLKNHIFMFTKTISVLSALCICAGLFAKDYNLLSPDGKISVTVSTAEEIT